MDKCCVNCKWYYDNKCNCKEINITIENDAEDQVTEFLEEGILNEGLKENVNLKELGRLFADELINNNCIKKNSINNVKSEDYSNIDVDVYEYIDDKISSILYRYFNVNPVESEIKINNPLEFSCCYWE